MRRAAFGVIQGVVAVLSLGPLAYGQQSIPCKYFSLVEKTSVESGGGLIDLQIRSDPGQFRRGRPAEFAEKCELALDTPAPWLTVVKTTPLDRKGYSTVTLRAEPNNVPIVRTASLTIGTPRTVFRGAGPHAANSIVRIEQAAVTPAAVSGPSINPGGIVNNASFIGQISPGGFFSIFGSNLALSTAGFPVPFPYSYNGTTVLISGTLCPLVYVSSGLINAQLPTNTPTGTVTVTVSVNGVTGTGTVAVVPASPGLFMLGDGVTAIVQHGDGSLATTTNPATANEPVTLYGTGIGPLNPPLSTDQVAGGAGNLSTAADSCVVQVNGVSAIIDYCGMTPGFIALAQINIRIPANVFTGTSIVTWIVNGVTSQRAQFASSGPGPVPALFTITNSKIAGVEGLDSSGNPSPCVVPAGKTSFLTTDSIVGVWFTYNNANVGDVLLTNWIHPSGAVTTTSSTLTFSGSGCSFHSLTISGAAAASEPGAWQVNVSVNGVSLFTLPFSIASPNVPAPVINTFTVSPASVPAGRSATLSWSVSNAASVSINNGIGSVASSGTFTVAPLATTTYTITATNSAGANVSQQVTLTVTAAINVTLYFTNNLIYPATIYVNGVQIGSIGAGTTTAPTTQFLTVPSPTTMSVSYFVTGRTSGGTAIGDPINAVYTTTYAQPSGNLFFTIGNTVGTTPYFAPIITNTSGTNLEMAANVDPGTGNFLDGDVNGKCFCVVNSGAGATTMGYYVFYSDSNVVGWDATDLPPYVGSDRFFHNFLILGGSGIVNLTFSVFP